ncbi:MAG: DUF1015 family protein [Nocardioidaceae bacterium]
MPSNSAARSTLQLSPFVAMRYNPDLISDLGDVTSPPYDVMDRSMIDSLLAGHPNNVVRLILPRLVTDPMAGQDPYARAANRMLRWREQSVLISDDQPALFVYEYGDAQHRMCGLIGAVGLREPQERVILPHEDVIEAIVEDRVAMLTAQEANLEPIMLTYDGEGEISDLIAEAQKQQPLVDMSLSDQTYHRIWRITDVEDLQRIANHLAPRQALIADGHHRYAAYLQCRQERAASMSSPWHSGLALLIDHSQCPLAIGPIHRSISDITVDRLSRAVEGMSNVIVGPAQPFEPNGLPSPSRGSSTDAPTSPRSPASQRLLVTDGEIQRSFEVTHRRDAPDSLAQVLHDELLPLWAVSEERLSYHHTLEQTLHAAHQEGGVAVFMPAASVEEVMSIAAAGLKMPRKSTSFGPKPQMGLIMRSFDDQEVVAQL